MKTLSRCTSDNLPTENLMKLFYRRYGTGPALIILHGLYGSSDNWIQIARKIDDRFTVIIPDLRNHGLSPHSDIHDYESMSNDLLELAVDTGLTHFFLAGHSMGGKVAIRFAMRWPEMLDGLLVADISPFNSSERLRKDLLKHKEIIGAMLSADISSAGSRREVEMLFSSMESERLSGFILKNLRRDAENRFEWKINLRALAGNIEKIMESVEPDKNDEGSITGFPVYFLKAVNSDFITGDDFVLIKGMFPAAEFITVPDAGHWVHADNPDAVVSALLKFQEAGAG
ncbi:MAG: alpha/beta fold hydrolase [Bacteroidales bacterium]|nr:alpha/beta fold hydrolase [Bacteroidales bacterium]